jgi:hypothetical protein
MGAIKVTTAPKSGLILCIHIGHVRRIREQIYAIIDVKICFVRENDLFEPRRGSPRPIERERSGDGGFGQGLEGKRARDDRLRREQWFSGQNG